MWHSVAAVTTEDKEAESVANFGCVLSLEVSLALTSGFTLQCREIAWRYAGPTFVDRCLLPRMIAQGGGGSFRTLNSTSLTSAGVVSSKSTPAIS